jgi:hypothetical protein
MFNSGGAIKEVQYDSSTTVVCLEYIHLPNPREYAPEELAWSPLI